MEMGADLESTRVRVKRDGPRGWHWISAASFDPAKHELVDPPEQQEVTQVAPAKRPPGRPRKPIQEP